MKQLSTHSRFIMRAGFWLAACLVLALGASVSAQVTGTINGRIVDASGAVLPGVTVNVTNTATGVVRTTVTTGEGQYGVTTLQSGTYEVKVELTGFSAATRPNVGVAAGQSITIDFSLSPGGVTENLTVSGSAPLIETTKSEVKEILRAREVQNLPLLNRNYTGLVALMPAVKPATPHDVSKNFIGDISVSGSAGHNINTVVDGGDNRDDTNGGVLMNFTAEGIEEFKLSSHRFAATEGRTSGGSLTIVTKSGTNDLHGTAFLFARGKSVAANDHFSKLNKLAKAPFQRQQFGGSIGGPIQRNRAFFFGAIERVRQESSITIPDAVFSELKLLAGLGLAKNIVQQVPQPFRDFNYTLKGNVQVNNSNSFIVRWSQEKGNAQNTQLADARKSDQSAPGIDTIHGYSGLVSLTSIINPHLLNQVTFHKNDFAEEYDSPTFPGAAGNLLFPSVATGRSGSHGQINAMGKWQIKDDFTAQLGAHAVQFGADYAQLPGYGAVASLNGDGQLTFFDDPSVILSNKVKYPLAFQTSGIVQQFSQATPFPLNLYVPNVKQFAAYVQDDWRVTPHLTLNLGVRYDLGINFMDESRWEKNRTYIRLKAAGNPYGRLPETPMKDFSPRVGFAYEMNGGKTVVRGGGGLYFDTVTVVSYWRVLLQNAPLISATRTLVNTAVGVGDLGTYRYGIDPVPGPPKEPTDLTAGGRSTGQWLDPAHVDPRTVQVNIGASHEIASGLVFTADYVHSVGTHEFRPQEVNPVVNGVRRLDGVFGSTLGDRAIFGSIRIYGSNGRSQFDMMNLKVEKRSTRATYTISYELGRAYAYGGVIAGNGALPQNQDDPLGPGEWGPSANDERHRLVAHAVLDAPYGFQVAPIFQASSARAYNLTAGSDRNRDGVNNDRYIDPATGQPVAINAGRGTPLVTLDLRVTRFFNLGSDKRRISAFAEFFNLFNRANFGNVYQGNSLSPTFRQPNGLFYGNGLPFQAQFGARFLF